VFAAGRGERVEPFASRPLNLVVVTFPFGVATPDAFRWWDQEGAMGPDPRGLLDAIAQAGGGDARALGALLFNDLEEPVIRRHPEVGEAKRILLEGGAVGAVMSGSGPSVVGLLRDEPDRLTRRAEDAIAELTGRPARYVGTETARRPGG
jgi:4-diphosphocytidyl-2-C-methyl-D-erythritol kinase